MSSQLANSQLVIRKGVRMKSEDYKTPELRRVCLPGVREVLLALNPPQHLSTGIQDGFPGPHLRYRMMFFRCLWSSKVYRVPRRHRPQPVPVRLRAASGYGSPLDADGRWMSSGSCRDRKDHSSFRDRNWPLYRSLPPPSKAFPLPSSTKWPTVSPVPPRLRPGQMGAAVPSSSLMFAACQIASTLLWAGLRLTRGSAQEGAVLVEVPLCKLLTYAACAFP